MLFVAIVIGYLTILLSIHWNLENLQTHVLDELNFHFNIMGVTEAKTTDSNPACCPAVQGYEFEYVPTSLPTLNYKVIKNV